MKNTVLAVYASGHLFSGQRFASEILVQGLRSRGWDVSVINTPVLERWTDQSNVQKKRALQTIKLLFAIPFSWLKVYFLGRRKALHLNVGQTQISLIREGFVILFHRLSSPNHASVVSLHGSWFLDWEKHSTEAKLLRLIAERAYRLTVLGEKQRGKMISLGIPQEKVILMDNTCTLEPLSEQQISLKQNLEPSEGKMPMINVLFLSNLIEVKGFISFVEAILQLSSRQKISINAILCGKITIGREKKLKLQTHKQAKEWIESKVEEVNSSKTVRLSWVDGAIGMEKENLLKDAHIFVLPSSQKEGQPLSIIESLASGCAVVTTRVGEIPSTVSEETAVFIDEGSPSAIAEAILSLAINSSKREQLTLNGLKLFKERFSYERHIDLWEELLESL